MATTPLETVERAPDQTEVSNASGSVAASVKRRRTMLQPAAEPEHAPSLLERTLGSPLLAGLIIAWFAVQASFVAFATALYIPPDERTHVRFIQLYARDGADPFITNQEGFFELGLVTRTPSYLYHWVLSLLSPLLPQGEEGAVVVLRLVNVALAVITLLVIWRLCAELGLARWIRTVTLFLYSNTLMVVFLAGSVNYDNLLVLLSVTSFWLLVRVIKELRWQRLLPLGLTMMAAALVKVQFLPLAVLITAVVLWQLRYPDQRAALDASVRRTPAWLRERPVARPVAAFVAALLLLGIGGLFSERYVGNLVTYGWVQPSCDEVNTWTQCTRSALFVRNTSWEDPGIEREVVPWAHGRAWFEAMRNRSFRIIAHQTTEERTDVAFATRAFFLVAALAAVRGVRRGDRALNALLGIALLYLVALLYVNYGSFLKHGQFGVALQGRYAFPVLPLLYGLGLTYLARTLGHWLVAVVSIPLMVVFGLNALPAYLTQTLELGDVWWRTEALPAVDSARAWLSRLSP